MRTSEQINELATALSKAQGEMTGAKKASNNPFFKSKYSDLSQVIEAISTPFANNGLCFAQGAEFDENKIAVVTRIMHSSGQWIESTTYLPPVKDDAQGFGSAITYAKRYGLQAMAGVPSVDDDGNAAVQQNSGQVVNLPRKKKGSVQLTKEEMKQEVSKSVDAIFRAFDDGDNLALEQLLGELDKSPVEKYANHSESQVVWKFLPGEVRDYITELKMN